jgi:hypothetical protein
MKNVTEKDPCLNVTHITMRTLNGGRPNGVNHEKTGGNQGCRGARRHSFER